MSEVESGAVDDGPNVTTDPKLISEDEVKSTSHDDMNTEDTALDSESPTQMDPAMETLIAEPFIKTEPAVFSTYSDQPLPDAVDNSSNTVTGEVMETQKENTVESDSSVTRTEIKIKEEFPIVTILDNKVADSLAYRVDCGEIITIGEDSSSEDSDSSLSSSSNSEMEKKKLVVLSDR